MIWMYITFELSDITLNLSDNTSERSDITLMALVKSPWNKWYHPKIQRDIT